MHGAKCIPNHPSSDCSHSVSYLILVREVVNVCVESLSLRHLVLTPEGAAAEHRCPPVSHIVPAVSGEGSGSHIGPDNFGELHLFAQFLHRISWPFSIFATITWSPTPASALSRSRVSHVWATPGCPEQTSDDGPGNVSGGGPLGPGTGGHS